MLYLFDIDGTLCRSFLREGGEVADFDQIELLPNRAEVLSLLRRRTQERVEMALVTNQGGVALGYQSVQQVCLKLTEIMIRLQFPVSLVCTRPGWLVDLYGNPVAAPFDYAPRAYVSFGLTARSGIISPKYVVGEDDPWRKPGPGMLQQAMRDHRAPPEDTVFVGDMESDELAAKRAGVGYLEAGQFFGC